MTATGGIAEYAAQKRTGEHASRIGIVAAVLVSDVIAVRVGVTIMGAPGSPAIIVIAAIVIPRAMVASVVVPGPILLVILAVVALARTSVVILLRGGSKADGERAAGH